MQFYANPYAFDAAGFYFETFEEFEEKYAAKLPVEEYEIEFIDGEGWEGEIVKAVGVNQANLAKVFDLIEELDGMGDWVKAGCWYRLSNIGETLEDVLGDHDYNHTEHVVHTCRGLESEDKALESYVDELIDEGAFGEIPEHLQYYIATDRIGRDMRLNGEVTVEDFDGTTYVFSNR
jgi:hypothetical protein